MVMATAIMKEQTPGKKATKRHKELREKLHEERNVKVMERSQCEKLQGI